MKIYLNDPSQHPYINSFLLGLARSTLIDTLLHPCFVIETMQQLSPTKQKAHKLAVEIFQREGAVGFFKGWKPQMIKIIPSQLIWPVIEGLPRFLDNYDIDANGKQLIIALSVSSLQAVITNPLNKWCLMAIENQSSISKKNLFENNTKSLLINWSRLTVNWMTFFVSQRHFKEYFYKQKNERRLTISELVAVSLSTAACVSLTGTPIKVLYVHSQSQHETLNNLFRDKIIWRKFFFGFPMNFFNVSVNCLGSVFLVYKFEKNR